MSMFDPNVQTSTLFDPLVESRDLDSDSPGAKDRSSSCAAKYLASGDAKESGGSPVPNDLGIPPGAKDLDVLGTNDFQIPVAFDPFAEDNDQDVSVTPGIKEYVHIRIQQRNGKKSLTTIQGLNKELSYQKILKDLKKEFCCNGTIMQDKELGKVIQLQGDQRKNVSQFLVNADIVMKEQIKIHGF